MSATRLDADHYPVTYHYIRRSLREWAETVLRVNVEDFTQAVKRDGYRACDYVYWREYYIRRNAA